MSGGGDNVKVMLKSYKGSGYAILKWNVRNTAQDICFQNYQKLSH